MQNVEGTGQKFNLTQYLDARTLCLEIVDQIALAVHAGISEKDGQELIKKEFAKHGITKFWHPSKFRIGTETTKNFRDLPDQSAVIAKDEMFFIDVGPIIDDHEADFGRTYIFKGEGSPQQQQLIAASTDVWKQTAIAWQESKLTGQLLYQFAEKAAQKLGFQLNMNMNGHRLGDFPHALFSKADLAEVDFVPAANLWVLEIHVISPELKRAAFFEDILLG